MQRISLGRGVPRLIVDQEELARRILLVHEVAEILEVGTLAGLVHLPQELTVLVRRLAQRE